MRGREVGHGSTVRGNRPPSAGSAREHADFEHHLYQRRSLCHGERLQVARPAEPLRKLIHGLLRSRRWSRNSVLDWHFAALRDLQADGGDVECFGLDSTSVKVHPDGTRARKATGPQSIGESRGGWNAKIHMISASDRLGVIFHLSGGAGPGRARRPRLLESWDKNPVENAPLAMDRAYEGDKTRHFAGNSASRGTRSNGCSADSRAAGASTRGSTSSTCCSWGSGTSL